MAAERGTDEDLRLISRTYGHPTVKLFEIIKTMRADKATYPQIASYLEDENIPTLSGKGKWNAQAVRRCAVKLN